MFVCSAHVPVQLGPSEHLPLPPVGYQLVRDPITGHFLLIPATNIGKDTLGNKMGNSAHLWRKTGTWMWQISVQKVFFLSLTIFAVKDRNFTCDHL